LFAEYFILILEEQPDILQNLHQVGEYFQTVLQQDVSKVSTLYIILYWYRNFPLEKSTPLIEFLVGITLKIKLKGYHFSGHPCNPMIYDVLIY